MRSNVSAAGDKGKGRRKMKQHCNFFFILPISNVFISMLSTFFSFIKKARIVFMEKPHNSPPLSVKLRLHLCLEDCKT